MMTIETRLAGATKSCPGRMVTIPKLCHASRCTCKGTGRVYFFPDSAEVRLQCMCRGHRDHDSKVTAHKLARINRMDSCSGFSGWKRRRIAAASGSIIVAARGLPASAGRGIAACLLRIRVGSCKVSSGVQ